MYRSTGNTVLIYCVCLFGSWTAYCYVIVLAGGSFATLHAWSLVPLVAGLLLGSWCQDRQSPGQTAGPGCVPHPSTPIRVDWETGLALAAMAAAVVVLRVFDSTYGVVWVVLLAATLTVFHSLWNPPPAQVGVQSPLPAWQRLGVIALIGCGAVLSAVSNRPDPDDAQYLNFVVTALDFPAEPLFSRSGLWQDHSTPLELPIYRFHTYELLVAVLSALFNAEHKTVYYMALPPLLGGIAVLVHWRLARHLAPQHALAVLLVWLVLILALGASHREIGNFAFVRIYQSKAILVAVALPLCLLLGLRFAEQPDRRRALALGMAALASLGMSSSALATVPFVVGAALSGGLLGSGVSARNTLIGGAGSLLALAAIGGALVLVMPGAGHQPYGDVSPSAGNGLSIVLGEGYLGALTLALFPLAPLFVADGRRRQLYLLATLTLMLAVFNPWTAPLLATTLDSALFWRVFWSAPLVFSAALTLGALAGLAASRIPAFAAPAVLPALLTALFLLSNGWSLSSGNRVFIGFPGFKVDPGPYTIADEIVRRAPPRSTVYAPIPVALMITTFRGHPYPLIVRPEYSGFQSIRQHFGDDELNRRRRVINFLEGGENYLATMDFFRAQLDRDRPAIVVYERGVETAPKIEHVLKSAGYIGETRHRYWLWRRE